MKDDMNHKINVLLELGLPFVWWDKPGVGKSAIIEQIAKKKGRHLEVIIASLRQPQDFLGWPVKENGTMKFAPPDWVQRLIDAKDQRPICFFDEITTCPPSVQAALLRVINEKKVDTHDLSHVTFVLAANPPDIAQGYPLTPAMANRLIHFSETPSLESWQKWFVGAQDEEKLSVYKQATEYQVAESLAFVHGFLSKHGDLDNKYPEKAKQASEAWPSRRTWHITSKIIAFCDLNGISKDNKQQFVYGTIGDGAGNEFLAYVDNLDLPDIKDVLAGKHKKLETYRDDQLFVVGSQAIRYMNEKKDKDIYHKVWDFLGRLCDANRKDIGGIYAKPVILYGKERSYEYPVKIVSKFKDIILDDNK